MQADDDETRDEQPSARRSGRPNKQPTAWWKAPNKKAQAATGASMGASTDSAPVAMSTDPAGVEGAANPKSTAPSTAWHTAATNSAFASAGAAPRSEAAQQEEREQARQAEQAAALREQAKGCKSVTSFFSKQPRTTVDAPAGDDASTATAPAPAPAPVPVPALAAIGAPGAASTGPTVLTVTLGNGVLGLKFFKDLLPMTIKSLSEGGQAACTTPKLEAGMELQRVNGEDVTGLSYSQANERIKAADRPLQLCFLKKIPQPASPLPDKARAELGSSPLAKPSPSKVRFEFTSKTKKLFGKFGNGTETRKSKLKLRRGTEAARGAGSAIGTAGIKR